jgi:hypothetical protein
MFIKISTREIQLEVSLEQVSVLSLSYSKWMFLPFSQPAPLLILATLFVGTTAYSFTQLETSGLSLTSFHCPYH